MAATRKGTDDAEPAFVLDRKCDGSDSLLNSGQGLNQIHHALQAVRYQK
jgi:hypothetical protein